MSTAGPASRRKSWFSAAQAPWSSASGLPIGPSPNGRTGHWDWLRYRVERHLPVTIVDDEYRSVVWARDAADRLMRLAESDATGIRHIAATRALSRIDLANYLLSIFGMEVNYHRESHHQRSAPHLGYVELATRYRGEMSKPIASVLDSRGAFLACRRRK